MLKAPSLRHVDFCLGGFSLAAIALHDAAHVLEGRWYDVFWVCNIAALLIGPAAIFRSAMLATIAFTWIVPGTVLWLLTAVVGDANLLPTSFGIHFGGSVVAAWAVCRSGRARNSFAPALALPAFAVLASRMFLPVERNVNVAFAVPRGFSALGASFPVFIVSSVLLVLLVCAAGQLFAELCVRAGKLLANLERRS